MRVPVSLRVAAPIAVMASIALLPLKAHAAFVFANPAGFGSQTSASSLYDFLGTGDLGVTAPFIGSSITLGESYVDFGATSTNPAWTGGIVQPMFRIEYSGSASGGPNELAQLDFTFANLLSSQSYMVFSDFDSYEGLAIAAYDQSNNLIPFANLSFSRLDGEMVGGASLATPTWTDTNPTSGWATDNAPWIGTGAVSGFLQDTGNSSLDDPTVALQANTSISRVSFYYNAESISGTGSNNLRFNFASPSLVPGSGPSSVPGPLPVLGIFAAFAFSRKLRQRINRG